MKLRQTSRYLAAAIVVLAVSGCMEGNERGWDIPTDPQEKAAYDYAHSLKLPDNIPKPVPFNFWTARLKAIWPWNPNVSEQYFDHLCKTEAGEYISKTVENVEGVFQMRPRGAPGKLDYDRYAPEEPTGLGWSNDVDNERTGYGVSTMYLLPMHGQYTFMERPRKNAISILRYRRGLNPNPPEGEQNGYQTMVVAPNGMQIPFSLPFMVVKEESAKRQARYGFTWRGIKREHDRFYSIGGGEYLIVDLDTNEILAVKRRFKLSGRDVNTTSHIWWGNARPCDTEMVRRWPMAPREPTPIDLFVKKVLMPVPRINDQYIPEKYKHLFDKGTEK